MGDTLSFNASTLDGVNQFAFWVINGFVRTDLAANLSVRVQSSMSVFGLFHTEGKHAVLFVDSNGKLIDQVSVLDNGTAGAPDVEGYTKPGGLLVDSVNPWKSLEGETSLENIDSSRVYVLQYTEATGDINILIEGGLVGSIDAVRNQVVVAVAANSSTFTHWADEEGNVLSYKPTYAFTALEDTKLFAKTTAVTPTSFVSMKDLTGIRDGYESYMGRVELQGDDYLVEYGFIYSDTTEDITLDTTGVVIAKSNVANAQTKEFLMSFVSEHHVTTRAYAIVDTGTEIVTIYSDLIVKNPVEVEPVVYTATIDTSGSYGSNIADGVISADRLAITNPGTSSISVSFRKNSSSTTSIFNNSGGQIRLYNGSSSNGGQLTISLSSEYILTSITVETDTNTGYSINGSSSISSKNQTTQLTEASSSSVVIKNVGSGQVRIELITITYTLKK
ncbi:hypothetical protein JN09_001307 [Acholeplasma morum]|uniref:hypothetical protein n=1 Tax=Paracholeplasma morum TaxID=264637 RepID=UPI00195787C5|nr:hypothetical protein [Paracholeplasma morum]MBM7453971.1 hypothetical protein [Paracholeplasma morum]